MASTRVAFDRFELDLENFQLSCADTPIELERRAFDLLCYLVANPDRLIGREELLAKVWDARQLSVGVLATAIARLRKAIGQRPEDNTPIETVRGRGYRLRAQVRAVAAVAAQPAAPSHLAQSGGEIFVGRAAPLRLLQDALERAHMGCQQLVLITGEAGIGKTRLALELASRARTLGFSVWMGRAQPSGSPPAFWPWIEIVRTARAQSEQQPTAAVWSALAPELSSPLAEPATRFALFDALTGWLQQLAAAQHRLLVLEDLHWADSGTSELLAHLSVALADSPLLLCATMREHTAPDAERTAAQRVLARAATHIPLQGLSASEVSQLIANWRGTTADWLDLAGPLTERTGGNPFFIRQLLLVLEQRGLAGTTGMSSACARDLTQIELPIAVRDAIAERIDALGEASRPLLSAAAAIGMELDAALLAELLGCEEADVTRRLEPALRAGVIVHGQRFGFAHPLLQESLYQALDLSTRGQLHARIAQSLKRRLVGADARALADYAHHQLHALPCELDACIAACRRAAEVARESTGFAAASQLTAAALDRLEAHGGELRVRVELLLELGRDLSCALDFAAARAALERGLELARELDELPLFARLACELAEISIADSSGRAEELRGLLDEALSRVGDAAAPERALLLAHRAQTGLDLSADGRYALMAEAERVAADSADPALQIELAGCRISIRHPTRIAEGRAAIARYRALTRRHPRALRAGQRLPLRFDADFSEYVCALTEGELGAARAAADRCQATAHASRMLAHEVVVSAMLAGRTLANGQLDQLDQQIAELHRAVVRMQSASSDAGVLGQLVATYYSLRGALARGDHSAVDLGLATSSVLALLPARQQLIARTWLAWAAACAGRLERARELLTQLSRAELARLPSYHGDLGLLCMLVETCRALDDVDAAAQLRVQLAPHAQLNAVGVCADYWGSIEHYLGVIALMHDDRLLAAQHARRALEYNRKLQMPLQLRATQQLVEQIGCG